MLPQVFKVSGKKVIYHTSKSNIPLPSHSPTFDWNYGMYFEIKHSAFYKMAGYHSFSNKHNLLHPNYLNNFLNNKLKHLGTNWIDYRDAFHAFLSFFYFWCCVLGWNEWTRRILNKTFKLVNIECLQKWWWFFFILMLYALVI